MPCHVFRPVVQYPMCPLTPALTASATCPENMVYLLPFSPAPTKLDAFKTCLALPDGNSLAQMGLSAVQMKAIWMLSVHAMGFNAGGIESTAEQRLS